MCAQLEKYKLELYIILLLHHSQNNFARALFPEKTLGSVTRTGRNNWGHDKSFEKHTFSNVQTNLSYTHISSSCTISHGHNNQETEKHRLLSSSEYQNVFPCFRIQCFSFHFKLFSIFPKLRKIREKQHQGAPGTLRIF